MKISDIDVSKEIICAVEQHLNIANKRPKVSEIGDGNINRVFRVEYVDTSMVVKYAPESAVILPSIKLSRERGEREGKYLSIAGEYSDGMVPEVCFYDKERHMLFIEDFGEVKTLSDKLIEGDFDSFNAEKLARFTADTCFFTSRYSRNIAKGATDASFDFHDLCKLTQELVFEQPYYPHENNHFMNANSAFVKKNVYENELLKKNAEELKKDFMENHEAVIHGDLHTASIFAFDKRNVVFDGEFSYKGPIAYDLGNVVAHLMMTFFRWSVADEANVVEADKIILKAFEYLDLFEKRFAFLLRSFGNDEFSKDEKVISRIISFSYKYAAAECLRRVIGLAKAPIFTRGLSDHDRALTERCLIMAGCAMITKGENFSEAKQLLDFCRNIYLEGMKMT